MRDIANQQLRDDWDKLPPPAKPVEPSVYRAHKQQGDVIRILDQMLDLLDLSRADEVEKLTINLKKDQKNVDDLAAKMAALQKEIEKALKIADPQARDKALKELSDKQRTLQKGAEQRSSDLARNQARAPANVLKEAAEKEERLYLDLDGGLAS